MRPVDTEMLMWAGRYPCEMVDFQDRMKYNKWYSLYVLSEAVSCIHMVVDECLKVTEINKSR